MLTRKKAGELSSLRVTIGRNSLLHQAGRLTN